MIICAVGDVHGRFSQMYVVVEALETEIGCRVDLVVQVGDLGVWPNPSHLDKATREHGGAQDAPRWFAMERAAPRPTIFTPGNHEDFEFLLSRVHDREILPDLTFLPWGEVITVGASRLKIGGVGGCFGASDYQRRGLLGKRRRHYTREDVERCAAQAEAAGGLDILLLHDAPEGRLTAFPPPGGKPRLFTSESQGLAGLVAQTQPRLCLHGHLHGRFLRRVGGVTTVGLNQVPYPGCAIVYEVPPEGEIRALAEWRRLPSWPEGSPDPDPVGGSITAPLLVELEPLVTALTAWREAVLMGEPLSREDRALIYERLPKAKRPRALLMGLLRGKPPEVLLQKRLDAGDSLDEIERWLKRAPDPSALGALLRP